MKIFGWKSAGREDLRPALSRYDWLAGGGFAPGGAWPRSYEAQVREGYCRNVIAQRSVRLVAEGLGGAPIIASDDTVHGLVTARSAGQALTETIAAHLLLHGIPRAGWIVSAWSRRRCRRPVSIARCRPAMPCAAARRQRWRR